jgi:hypothetical protein
MVEFEGFGFAAPPCTGSRWFVETMRKVDGVVTFGNVRAPAPKEFTGFVLSIVRHPLDWLLEYYSKCRDVRYLVPAVDVFQDDLRGSKTFEDFVQVYLGRHAGYIGAMFDSYKPSSVMKYEDLPWCAVEFLQSIRRTNLEAFRKRPPEGPCGYHRNREMVRAVVKAEREFCSRLDYF